MGEEYLQDPQRLFLEPDLGALFTQFSGAHVEFERAEADDLRTGRIVLHPVCCAPSELSQPTTTAGQTQVPGSLLEGRPLSTF